MNVDKFIIDPEYHAEQRRKAREKAGQDTTLSRLMREGESNSNFTADELLDWCYRYLPNHFYGERAEFHHEIAHLLATEDRVAVAAPRGHNKSTLVSLGYVLFMTATKRARFVVIISDVSQQAADHVGNVQRELLENERLVMDYPHLRLPDQSEYKNKKVRRKAHDFITSGSVRFSSKGAEGALRGMREGNQRPDLIVVDDLENDKNVETPDQRKKLKSWFQKSLSNLFSANGGRLLIIGTILHRESLLSWILSENGPKNYAKRRYSAIMMDEEGHPKALWPAAWTLERLYQKRAEISSRAFATEFLNDPTEDDEVLFKSSWIRRAREVPENFVRIVVGVDPSAAGDGARDACGIVVAGKTADNTVVVLEDCTLNGSPSKWGRAVLEAAYRWNADIVAEANQGGEMVRTVILSEVRPGEFAPKIDLDWARHSKGMRAQPVAAHYERGGVLHHGNLDELEAEMTSWIPGKHSPNRLDALVWALASMGVGLRSKRITTTYVPRSMA